MARKKTIFAVWDNHPDELFIEASHCGIDPLIFLIDGIGTTYETNKKGEPTGPAYIKASVALEWHQKELEHTVSDSNRKKRRAIIASIEDAIAKTKAGKFQEPK